MKTSTLILSLMLGSALISDELSWVDKQVQAIKPSRQGMKKSELSNMKDPFIFLAKNGGEDLEKSKKSSVNKASTLATAHVSTPRKVKTVSKVLTLGLIMNNSVLISGEWYKLGDRVNGYKITEISRNSVLLTKKKKKLLLSTKSNNNNLTFKR